MSRLTRRECDTFWEQGYLLVTNAVTDAELSALREDMARWCEDSRAHDRNYGETINGKPRFDLDPTHSADHPAIRRVNAPVEVSSAHHKVAMDSTMVDAVADLIGPNVKFHHSKTNSKQPHTVTPVKFHQDFPFTPHSNDNVVTALLMLDDVDETNGALQVVPGSHRGPIYSLWSEGHFNGYIDPALEEAFRTQAVTVTGKAGSVCLMHTRLLHGSAPNDSATARTLFICVYSSDDAVALSPNPMPSAFEGQIVRGERTGTVRSETFSLELPQLPSGASFFEQQGAKGPDA